MLSIDEIKQQVAESAVELVKQDMVLGVGSGSTMAFFVKAIGKRMKEGLRITAVPTSSQTRALAATEGIEMTELNEVSFIDLTIDGADEVDQQLHLIKGGGGYLLQEKMIAAASKELVIIADNNKMKMQLGEFPLPVEVIPYGWTKVSKRIQEHFEVETTLRIKENKPFLTDHGHYILDCFFKKIPDPANLNIVLHLIPGVVETGLFINMCRKVLVGHGDGSVQVVGAENSTN